jgi:hypothetical protein
LPSITNIGDTNTGIFFPAADTIAFTEGGVEAARFDSSGQFLVGTTTALAQTTIYKAGSGFQSSSPQLTVQNNVADGASGDGAGINFANATGAVANIGSSGNGVFFFSSRASTGAGWSERMRINSSGVVLVGKTSDSLSVAGAYISPIGEVGITQSAGVPLYINRLTNDGVLVQFRQDNSNEGDISVSGSTVSYNGGHLSRWSQLPDNFKDESILKGTVLSNLDEMCVWEKDGVVAENEQLNKMKVSDVEGDTNVAGVFVNWTIDDAYGVDDMNVAMTGDMIIRIADGVVVQKGDLLMSAGDGTAKPQGDDIVRSKTVAKVTSNHVTCTYADGSYCVPCVLMAC